MRREAKRNLKSVVCAVIVGLSLLSGMKEARGRIADLDFDGNVNFSDYAILATDWMKKGSGLAGDINGDNVVDYNDLEILGEDWLFSKKPNGKIAFVSSRDGNYEIYVMDANGSNQERLTYDERRDTYPAWSPDGKKLAYVSGGGREISIIELETGIQTVIFRACNKT